MAVNALMGAAYGSAGERRMAISVAVPVTDRVADALIERLAPKIEALKVGPRRTGRRQRPDPGADGFSLVRQVEGVTLRRPPHARA
jgi:acyl-CoA reductase-like NAD-dependent aldehyde dehydrogenase